MPNPNAVDPFSGADLVLGSNEDYRNDLVAAARRAHVRPQVVAAELSGEAGDPDRRWDPNEYNRATAAAGMAQLQPGTWKDEAERPGTYLNGVARNLGYLDRHGKVIKRHMRDLLKLRYDAQDAINTAADYAAYNLSQLPQDGPQTDQSLAEAAYLGHHEGPRGAQDFLAGTPRPGHFAANVPKGLRAQYLRQNGGDESKAYTAWMQDFLRQKINTSHFTRSPNNPGGAVAGPPHR